MESFEEIQQKEFAQLTGEIGTLARRLVELGWSRDPVLAFVTQLFNEPTEAASEDKNSGRKED
jgi:hypothetical protein